MMFTFSALTCLVIPVVAIAIAGALGLRHGVVYFNYPGVKSLSESRLRDKFNSEVIKTSLAWALVGLIVIAIMYLSLGDGILSIYTILALNIISIAFIIFRLNHYVRLAINSNK